MTVDTLTPRPETTPTPTSEAVENETPTDALALADGIDGSDVLDPEREISRLAALDLTQAFLSPPEPEEPVAETPEAQPGPSEETLPTDAHKASVEKGSAKNEYVITNSLTGEKYHVQIGGPVTVASMKAALIKIGEVDFASKVGSFGPDDDSVATETQRTAAESETIEPEDPNVELNEGEQALAEARLVDIQKRMAGILADPKTPEATKQTMRESAKLLGIDLESKAPEKKKFTKKQWALIALIGAILVTTMPIMAGAAATKA